MSVRHLILDLDGTLVDSAVHCAEIVNEMLEKRGSERRLSRCDAAPHMSYGGQHLVEALLGRECGDPVEELDEFRAVYAARPTPEDCLYPGVRAGLAVLAASGFVLGLCSNKPQALCDKIVDELGLRASLTSVVGTRVGLPAKPDPAMLMLNLAEMNGSPDTTLVIGDSEVDHALAAAADVPFWLVSYGYAGPAWAPKADALFDSFDDVVSALITRDAERIGV